MSDPATSKARVLQFGALDLDVRAGELRKHGIRIRLGEQPFQILLMLLHKPGEIVLRDDIRQRLWPNNTIVEFDHSINAAINRLRAALGETAERPRYIETVGSRGYRFVGEVEAPDAPAKAATPVDGASIVSPDSRLDGDDLAGQTIAHYRLIDELGSGGMGVVYRAEDLRLGRQVALKFLPGELAADPVARQRFEREARAASALNHPNICTIYGVEESEGRLFLAMELLDGMTLQARLASGPLPRPQALSYAAQICNALDAAHRRGLVHRDMKPANVMLTKNGVKVLDFGLAKMQPAVAEPEAGGDGITETGTLLGTVQYMSPEQVEGKDADTRSDIFSFGMVLYEMLTGRRAFQEPGRAQLIAAILQKEPVWGELPPEVERVVRRCLAKDPDARWQSAADLRDELEWVGAGPAKKTRHFKLRLPEKRTTAMVAASAVIFAAGIFVADRPLVDLSHVRFTPMVMDSDYNEHAQWSPDGRSFAYNHNGVIMLRSLDAPVPAKVATNSEAIVFSKDGQRLYFTRPTGPATGRKVWTVAVTGGDPEELPAEDLGGGYMFDGITISPDGKALIALRQEADRSFSLCSSSPPGAPWTRIPYPGFPSSVTGSAHLRFSPDGKQMLAVLGVSPGELWILPWPPAPGRVARRAFSAAATGVSGADWMADSRYVLMHLAGKGGGEGGLYIGDTETGRIYPLELQDSQASQPSANPDGRFLVRYSDTERDIIEVPLDGSAPRPLIATKRLETGPDWSRSGDQMVYMTTRNGPQEIWIWSPSNDLQRPLVTQRSLPGNRHSFARPRFSPDGKRVAFGGDGAIWVIPATGGAPLAVTPQGGLPSWSPDGQWLAYLAVRNGKMFLEKLRLGTDRPVTLHQATNAVEPVWSPDGRWITLPVPGGLDVISPDGQVTRHLHRTSSWTSACWSRDGKTLYLGITDAAFPVITAALWAIDPDTGRERAIGHYNDLYFGGGLSASPDGKSLAAQSTKPNGYIWLVEGLKPPESFWQRMFSK